MQYYCYYYYYLSSLIYSFLHPSAPACGKAWMLERVVGFEVEGYDDIVLEDVADRLSCADLCLSETNLKCRSAEYDER